jgi:hypothetical protein
LPSESYPFALQKVTFDLPKGYFLQNRRQETAFQSVSCPSSNARLRKSNVKILSRSWYYLILFARLGDDAKGIVIRAKSLFPADWNSWPERPRRRVFPANEAERGLSTLDARKDMLDFSAAYRPS